MKLINDENKAYKLDLNKFEKPYLDIYINQISFESVQRFEASRKILINGYCS